MSGYSPWWLRVLYHVPYLFKRCPQYNMHWRWHHYCYCGSYNHVSRGSGGIYNFSTGMEEQL